jgi:tRNA (mo5U34)-methyltransferase
MHLFVSTPETPIPTDDAEALQADLASVRWYHRIEVRPGVVTPGINDCQTTLRLLDLPADCSGLRVLDIGTKDGFFAFEMERRGADVLAVDYDARDANGFAVVSRLLGSRVPFLHANLYNLDPKEIGTFDIVLFLGVIYHLPDPLGALRIVRRLCRRRMYLETFAIDHHLPLPDGAKLDMTESFPELSGVPLMCFFRGRSFNNNPTNFWGPNIQCVKEMLGETEFAVLRTTPIHNRAIFECEITSEPDTARVVARSFGERP